MAQRARKTPPETAADPLDAAQPLRLLVGPTASGKSALALAVAERAGAEIVSVDSMQVYRGMDVGTAKPSAGERARVRHHLLDRVDPHERYDVQRFLADVRDALEDVLSRGGRALFVGGTGFYLKALTHGLFEGPPVDRALRARLEARAEREGAEALHATLAEVDAASAGRLHPRDVRRVVRALEVWEQTGRALSDWQREWRGDGERPRAGRERRMVGLARPKGELEGRIRARTRAMLAAGWVEEAVAIGRAGGFGPTSAQALGYPEVLRHAAGETTAAELEDEIVLRTRQFARRQRTWFRHYPETDWLPAPSDEASREVAVTRACAAFGW